MQAELVSLNVSCCPDGDGKSIDVYGPTQIVFAVIDSMTEYDVILPSAICDELRTANPCLVMTIPSASYVGVRNRLTSVIMMNHNKTNSHFSQIQFHTTKAMICLV